MEDMLYSVSGKLAFKGENFLVVEAGGIGFKVFASERTIRRAGARGNEVKLFTHFHVREDAMELYGFLSEEELSFFELLISVSGVGPKSAIVHYRCREPRGTFGGDPRRGGPTF